MLTIIREKTQGIIAIFILGLLIIPFALWGIGSYFEGGLGNIVAKVNDIEISRRAFEDQMRRYRQRAPKLIESKAGRRIILDSIIKEQLQVSSAQDMGFVIGEDQIRNMIFGSFQTRGGFDPRRYQQYLSNVAGQSAYGFETALRQRGAVEQLRGGLQHSAIVTRLEVNDILKLQGQQRSFDYVAISLNSYLGRKKFDDAAARKYYDENLKQFMSPEQVKIEYVVLSIAGLAKQAQPTEKETRAYYLENKTGYATPEKRKLSHILIKSPPGASSKEDRAARAKAESVLKKARSGANFAVLAKKYSDDPGSKVRGGDVGYIKRGQMVKEFEAVAYQLKPGRVSGLVKTAFGYHILKMTAYKPGKQLRYAEVKDRIKNEIALERADKRFGKLYSDFNNYVYEQADSLKPVATSLGLKIYKTDWITRRGGAGLLANPDVIKAAFDKSMIEEKRNSDTLELGSDKLVSLHVVAHRPQKPKPFAEVKGFIKTLLERKHAQSLAVADGEKMLQAAKSGKPLAVLAKQSSNKYKQNNTLKQSDIRGMGLQLRGMARAVFRAGRPSPGKSILGGVEIKNLGYIVYSLNKVVDGPVAKGKADRRAAIIRATLQQRRGLGYYQDYTRGLKDAAKIKVYEKLL
ncbi:MAG: peptidyl-prolyl cis-trans isomerase [Gammaproteobacteria bacterium]|nr:MAG: peptidyl-prolyl cis-trans isomerase [Gammaproteobacteria bacterium]